MLFHAKMGIIGKYFYVSDTLFILYLEGNHTLFGDKLYFIWKFSSGNTKRGSTVDLFDLFSSNYANELLGSYITCIFTMYNYMSLCYITYLTSRLLQGFASNFVMMFLGWTPTKFANIKTVQIRVPPLF